MGYRIGSRAVVIAACVWMMDTATAQVEPVLVNKDGRQSSCVLDGAANGTLSYKLFPEATRVEKIPCADVLVYIDASLNVYKDACAVVGKPAPTTIQRNCASLIGKDRSVIKCDILEHGDQFKVRTALGDKTVPESQVAVHLEADGALGFQRTEDVVSLLSDPEVLRKMNDVSQCPALAPKAGTIRAPKQHAERLKAAYDRQKEVNKVKPRTTKPLNVDTTGRGVMKEPDFDAFDSIAMYKVKRLEGFIGQIVNIEKSMVDRDNAALEAIKLFNSPTLNKVEVSSLRGGKEVRRNHSVGTYFNSVLKSTKAKVDVKWSQMVFASDWEMQEDSSYRATISIQQTYVKELDGRVVYSDVTNKNIDVIAQVYDKFENGRFEKWWDVFLGDIGVTNSTKQ